MDAGVALGASATARDPLARIREYFRLKGLAICVGPAAAFAALPAQEPAVKARSVHWGRYNAATTPCCVLDARIRAVDVKVQT